MENCLEVFGQRLKLLRKERGITQQQLADGIGISKGALCYYENDNRAPDITVLEKFSDYFDISADYLLGRTNAQTQKPKLKGVCDYTGLSDKAVNMLAGLKKENPARHSIVNYLLERAADDICDDYELDGEFGGSFLNAIVRYLDRFNTIDSFIADYGSSEDEGISSTIQSAIQSAIYQLVLNQVVEAAKNAADEIERGALYGNPYDEE